MLEKRPQKHRIAATCRVDVRRKLELLRHRGVSGHRIGGRETEHAAHGRSVQLPPSNLPVLQHSGPTGRFSAPNRVMSYFSAAIVSNYLIFLKASRAKLWALLP